MDKRQRSGGAQYSLYRLLLGTYLTVHFLHLLPYAAEVFSSAGALADAAASPLMGVLPNPLSLSDTPWVVTSLVAAGAMSGVLLAIGYWHRLAALAAALILAWLFARNPLIANPSLPVVGWLLMAHLFVPPRPYGAVDSRGDADAWSRWRMPGGVWLAAWVVLALAYSYSGYTKLLSPSWVSGDTIGYVLQNPLARDHLLREWLLDLPQWMLRWLTWTVLYVELLFAPLALIARLRPWLWGFMFVVQLGFLALLNFADLTFPMLLIHLFTFDRRWLPEWRRPAAATLFFDGYCAFCNALVRFVLAEDIDRRLTVAALQSDAYARTGCARPVDDTIVLVDDRGRVRHKSSAVGQVLIMLGGIWLLLGYCMLSVPRPLRDAMYDLVGRIRYRLGRRLPTVCETLPLRYRQQLRS